MSTDDKVDADLPPQPDRPDCCAGGCAQCVLDDYAEDMQRWRQQVDEILRARAAARDASSDQAPDTPV